jgi:PAS domain S-box-containing protein
LKVTTSLPRYGFAALVTGLALLVQLLLQPYVQTTPFLLFFAAVMLSGYRGGGGAGVLATGLSALAADYFFLPPRYAFSLGPKDLVSVSIFVLISLLITLLNVRAKADRAHAKAQQQRLRRLFMEAPAIVNTQVGPEHVFEFVHPHTYKVTGPRELEGKPLRQAVPEFEGQGVYELLDRVYQTGEPFVGKGLPLLFKHAGTGAREETFFDITYQPMRDAEGRIEGVMTFAVDVSAEVLARRQLEASEARLRLATEVSGVGIWEVDLATGKTWRSEQHDRAFGYTTRPEQWSVEHFLQHIHPEDRERVHQAFGRAQDTRGEFDVEFRVTWPDGSPHWMAVHGGVQLDASGKPTRLVGTNLDITHRKKVEQELERAVRLRDEFLSVASHELRTPLTSLILKLQTFSRALRAEADSPWAERRRGDVEMMGRQVKRLSDLVDDLLDVSRISTGRLDLQLEPVDLVELVRGVASRLEPSAERAHCTLELDLGGPLVGQWDRLRLEQVVENLLSNAIKYGAGRPIHVRVGSDLGRASLVVRDQGIGIPPEALERIFGRFERAVSDRNYGGLGLGLYITWQIVSALGGSIHVESLPGQGATFTVDLPLPSAYAEPPHASL